MSNSGRDRTGIEVLGALNDGYTGQLLTLSPLYRTLSSCRQNSLCPFLWPSRCESWAAISQLQLVLKSSPDDVPSQMLLGAVNFSQGNYGQAEMYFSNVIGVDPESITALKASR